MNEIEVLDKTPLLEKIMAHFGWYKTKKVDMLVENMEVKYTFQVKDTKPPEFPVGRSAIKKPVLKKATTRKKSNGN